MIALTLIRHARAEAGGSSTPDHARPLADAGVRDARAMAERLVASPWAPAIDAMHASTAVRARETATVFGDALALPPTLDGRLYGAPGETLLRIAAEAAAAGARSIALVAHDPGLSVLAAHLAPAIDGMPTCGVAQFAWDDDEFAIVGAVPPARWRFAAPGREWDLSRP